MRFPTELLYFRVVSFQSQQELKHGYEEGFPFILQKCDPPQKHHHPGKLETE